MKTVALKFLMNMALFTMGLCIGFASAVGEARLTWVWWGWFGVSTITFFGILAHRKYEDWYN